ncbi:MAG: restriction endonuclease subunit S [Chloroflexota bacterium]|nr:restriction endonuclease subunit S [Chloroflexota bacterium]
MASIGGTRNDSTSVPQGIGASELGSRWEEKSLAEVVGIKHGFAFKSAYFQKDPSDDVLLTPGNFAVGGGFKNEKIKYYNGPIPEEYVLSAGDLIVTMTDLSKNSDTLGYPAIVPRDRGRRRFLHNQRIGKVIVNSEKDVDIRFLYYLMCSKPYRDEILASATGTTVKHTSPDRIRRFSFNMPPLPVQRRVAHILGTLDDKIELNRRMNATLEGMARALFKSWFVDFEPVRAKMEGRWRRGKSLPGMPAELYDLFPERLVPSEIGEVPEGWEVGTIGDCFNLTMGQSPPGSTYNEDGEGMPFFQGRADFGFRYPENRRFCTAPTRIAQPDNTLVSVRAPVGSINMAWEQCCIGRGLAALRHNSGSASYTYYAVMSIQPELQQYEHTGTVFGAINKRQFEVPFAYG